MKTPRMPRRRRSVPGFTLIELLVAISILAIVAVLGWRGLDAIVRSRATLTSQMEQTRGLQLAFAQMESDCANLTSGNDLHGRANLQAQANGLTLVRSVFAENDATRLQVVSYRVRDGVLTRRESGGTRDLMQLDAQWQAALNDTDPTPGVVLQQGVAGLAMRLWVNDSWRPAIGATVQQQPAPAATANVPTGLEMAVQMGSQETALIKVFLLGAI
jgi:general secretion pathway protein J